MKEFKLKVIKEDSGMRLDAYILKSCLKHDLGFSRTHIQKIIREGNVTLNGAKLKPNYKLKVNDLIQIVLEEARPLKIQSQDIPLDIVYEDKDLMVINKPVGLVVHPAPGNYSGTLANALLFHTSELSDVNPQRPGIVHRLDKETSGIMLVAKNNKSHLFLSQQFNKHTIKRRYVAVVKGRVEFDEGKIDLPIARHKLSREKMAVSFHPQAKIAVTYYRTIGRSRDRSLLELTPHTGRTHQLRVHLSSLGHPICGDRKYGELDIFQRMFLHAEYIGFIHPRTKKFMEFATGIPKEFVEMVK